MSAVRGCFEYLSPTSSLALPFLPHIEVFSIGQVDLSIDFRIPSEPTRMFRRECKLSEDIVGVGTDLTEQEGSQSLMNR